MPSPPADPDPLPPAEIDDLDRAIIAQLQQDGRRSYRAMARELGEAETTVRFRATRLQKSGVVSVTAFADPERLGYGVLASLFIRTSAPRRQAVIDELASWREVMYVSSCAGRADLMIQVVCRSLAELNDVLAVRVGELEGVLEVEALLELKVHKAHYEFDPQENG